MKTFPIILIALLFSGCMTVSKFQGVIQDYTGSGTVSANTPWFSGSCAIENGRVEEGQYKADKLDLNINAYGGTIEVHGEPYSRPVVEEE
ncbi:MAG: hypothetical protein ACPGEF_04525 [Endozoicomonas sp.]